MLKLGLKSSTFKLKIRRLTIYNKQIKRFTNIIIFF